LWDDHAFSDVELEFWSQEIFAAALEVEDSARAEFVGRASAGSDRLRRAVEALLDQSWRDPLPRAFVGLCQPGDVVADCFILRPVGRGGMGEVYKAIQRPLKRLVAVKVVTGGVDRLPAVTREAVNTSQLLHPNIVTVYHADLRSERPCLVMEYVDGVSLRTWLDRHWAEHQRAPAGRFIQSVVRQVGLAVGEAHRRGFVHCDLKPENVLLTRRGDEYLVKVVDFGIARRLETPAGALAGTPGYVAPEQLQGASPDARADLFALGVILYELLTGAQPFAAPSNFESYFKTLNVFPTPPRDADVSAWWPIARRALEKDPHDRYQTAQALVAELDRPGALDAGVPRNPLLSELPEVIQQWWQRHSSGFVVAVASFVWGAISLLLSVASGSACVRVFWGSPDSSVLRQIIYGYAVEANAGLWYLLGASLCALTGFAFLDAAFRGLARTNLFVVGTAAQPDPGQPLDLISSRNQRAFRYLTPAILLLALAFVVIPEGVFRRDHAFGWVQADLAAEQLSRSYEALKNEGKIGNTQILHCEGCDLRVTRVYNDANGSQVSRYWFTAFLSFALGHQIALVAFLMWVVAKILFFFGLLSTSLLTEGRRGLRLTPDFYDTDDFRFGLGRLDNVYYTILMLVAVAALGLFLQAAANVAKGTYYFAGDPAPALFGQPVLLIGTLCLLGILLMTPVGVFLLLTIKAVDAEFGRLSEERRSLEASIRDAGSADERGRLGLELERLRERRAIVRKQRLLPLRSPTFVAMLGVVLVMLLAFPYALRWLSSPARVADGGSRSLVETVCAACGNDMPRLPGDTSLPVR
jgi:hypothetical protein